MPHAKKIKINNTQPTKHGLLSSTLVRWVHEQEKLLQKTGITRLLLQEIAIHLNPAFHPATEKKSRHQVKVKYGS